MGGVNEVRVGSRIEDTCWRNQGKGEGTVELNLGWEEIVERK